MLVLNSVIVRQVHKLSGKSYAFNHSNLCYVCLTIGIVVAENSFDMHVPPSVGTRRVTSDTSASLAPPAAFRRAPSPAPPGEQRTHERLYRWPLKRCWAAAAAPPICVRTRCRWYGSPAGRDAASGGRIRRRRANKQFRCWSPGGAGTCRQRRAAARRCTCVAARSSRAGLPSRASCLVCERILCISTIHGCSQEGKGHL